MSEDTERKTEPTGDMKTNCKLQFMKPIISITLGAAFLTGGCATMLTDSPYIAHNRLIDETSHREVPTRTDKMERADVDVLYAKAGVTEIGGELSASTVTTTIEGQKFSNTSIKLEPSIGHFVRDGFSLFGGALLESEIESSERSQSTTTTTGLFTGLAYFVTVSPGSLYVGPGVQVGFAKASTETDGASIAISGLLLVGSVTAKIQLGTSALLSLGANLGYQSLDISAGGQAVSGDNFTINVTGGASVFF